MGISTKKAAMATLKAMLPVEDDADEEPRYAMNVVMENMEGLLRIFRATLLQLLVLIVLWSVIEDLYIPNRSTKIG